MISYTALKNLNYAIMQEVHQTDGLSPYRNLSYEKYKADAMEI